MLVVQLREEAVVQFLEDTPVGSRSSGMARAKVSERESVGQVSEGEEGGPAGPAIGCLSFCFFPLSYFYLPFVWRLVGSKR